MLMLKSNLKPVLIALTALVGVSAPAGAQTTNCRYIVAGRPDMGITCETQPQTPAPQYNNELPQLTYIQPQQPRAQAPVVGPMEWMLRQREMRLRERELALRERELQAAGK